MARSGEPTPPDSGGGDDAAAELEEYDLRRFFEQTRQPMIILDASHAIVDANDAAARFLHVHYEELIGTPAIEIAPLARLLAAASILQKLRTDPSPVVDEVAISDAEGQGRQCRVEAIRVDDERIVMMFQDSTSVLRAHQIVRQADRSRRAIFDALPDVAWAMALPEERLLEISPAVERLFGHQPAAFRQDPELWVGLVHPSDRERTRDEFRRGLATGRPFEIRFTGLHKDRRTLPHLVNHVIPLADERGWTDRCEGFIRDESPRVRLEQRLNAVEANLRHVVDSVGSGVVVLEPGEHGPQVALVNRRLVHMLRLDEVPKPGTPLAGAPAALRALVCGPQREADLERLVASEDSIEDVTELKDPRRVLRRYAGPVRDRFGGVIGHIVAVEDVTPSWLLQQRLTQAQKMESMGRLAGGVAHDFNNLLGTVLGFGSLLLEQTERDDPRREGLELIVQAAERASRLTQALLRFSRGARFERTPVRLNDVVEETYQILRSTLDPAIVVELKLDLQIPSLLGDALLLQQVIVSLVQAASERLAGAGALRITTRMHEPGAARGGAGEREPQPMVELAVEATPMRALPDAADVEPTFVARTDRDGLALTIADDITRAHGGALLVGADAAPALFRMRLPINAFEETPAIVPEAPAARGHETILVVDDEPALRALAKGGLTQLGFDVITAASGEEALGVLRSRPRDIAAVLLDLSMPGLSGERVLRTIRGFQPDLPVIIASGFATVESQQAWRAAGAQDFVAKPYRVQDVALKLRGILDQARGPVS